MSLSNNLSTFGDKLSKLPQQKIAQALTIALLIYLAYLFAQITWLFVPQENASAYTKVTAASTDSTRSKKQFDITAIKSLELFGRYNEKIEQVPESVVEDAPETRLKLILSGVVASSDKATAAAIIENAGKQDTYSIGDTINGTRARLDNIFSDRVLLKVSGKLETLMFEGAKDDKNTVSRQPRPSSNNQVKNPSNARKLNKANVVDQRNNKQLSASASSLKADLSENPGNITDYLKITPKREGGNIIGYQLMPGKNPTFFQNSGLKSGDVAVQMNGLDLTEPREAAQALQSLKEQQEVSLLLNRDGDMTEILFSIDN